MIEQDSTLLGFFNPYNIQYSGCNHDSDTSGQTLNYFFVGRGYVLACLFIQQFCQ
jgi:hypothetical protein